MRSEKQRAASRLNGAKSCGPVTADGKRNTCQNATRHGAFAHAILLPTESGEAFDILADATFQEFDPATPFEASLVEDMISARWRAKRFAIMERALIKLKLQRLEQQAADTDEMSELDAADITGLAFQELADNSQALQLLHRYAVRFHREYLRSHHRLIEVQNRRRDTPPPTQPGPPGVPIPVVPNNEVPMNEAAAAGPSPSQGVENQEQTQQTPENTSLGNTNPAVIAFVEVFAERVLAKPREKVEPRMTAAGQPSTCNPAEVVCPPVASLIGLSSV
jgi:hypothetical protein